MKAKGKELVLSSFIMILRINSDYMLNGNVFVMETASCEVGSEGSCECYVSFMIKVFSCDPVSVGLYTLCIVI